MFENFKELNRTAMGRRIRVIREDKGITREMIDVSAQFIADVEYGNKGVSIRKLFLLAQALEVTSDYILAGKLYAVDEDSEAMQICDDIIALLRTCSLKQLKDFRDISRIYAENVFHKD